MMRKVILSNRLEQLADALGEALFSPHLDPFAIRRVCVPSRSLKLFLQERFAQKSGIAAGFTIQTLEELCTELFQAKFPSRLELSIELGSDQLASLFAHHALYGEEELSEEQQKLWDGCFSHWDALPAILKKAAPLTETIHLFAFPFLSSYAVDFFKRGSAVFYLLSPTQFFWEDVRTDRERVAWQRALKEEGTSEGQIDALETFLKEGNPLLSNWSRLRRKYLASLSVDEMESEELYESAAASQLGALQNDLLNMSVTKEPDDGSITIFSAPSRMEEVKRLCAAIATEMGEGREPKEIQVFAPDIASYVAPIQLVFGERGIPFAVTDLPASTGSGFAATFLALLDLPKRGFRIEAALKLFYSPEFQQQWGWSQDDVEQIEKWCEKGAIRTLSEDQPGFQRLLLGLITTDEKLAIQALEMQEAELFGGLIGLMRRLQTDLATKKERSLEAWIAHYTHLIATYFGSNQDGEECTRLLRHLGKRLAHLKDKILLERDAEKIVRKLLQRKSGAIQSSQRQVVRFGSLESGRVVPAQVIALLGMEEGAFPRAGRRKFPTEGDEDRGTFLDAILAAREKLIISTRSIDPEDGKAMAPSLLVEELLRFLERDGPETTKVKKEKVAPIFSAPSQLREREKVEIRELTMLAKDPIKLFCKKNGIGWSGDKPTSEFILSGLDRYQLRKEVEAASIEEVVELAIGQGKLPEKSFRGAAAIRLKEELSNYRAALEALNVDPSEIFSVHFQEGCRAEEWVGVKAFYRPPLEVILDSGRRLQIVGTLPGVTKNGMVVHAAGALADIVKVWPQILLLHFLEGVSTPTLLLTKGAGKAKEMRLENPPSLLREYLTYFEEAQKEISPLIPELASYLFKGDEIRFIEKFEEPSLGWVSFAGLAPDPSTLFGRWSQRLRPIFTPLLEEADATV
jgi:exodeoxyribonuclease V gamma subunit